MIEIVHVWIACGNEVSKTYAVYVNNKQVDGDKCLYAVGYKQPHYPMPAIRERGWYEVMVEWYDLQYSAVKARDQAINK